MGFLKSCQFLKNSFVQLYSSTKLFRKSRQGLAENPTKFITIQFVLNRAYFTKKQKPNPNMIIDNVLNRSSDEDEIEKRSKEPSLLEELKSDFGI